MKTLTLVFLLLSISALADDIMSASDAAKKGLISVSFKGNSNSTHYTIPLIGTFTNLKNKEITIKVENGRTFIAKDSVYQNLVITEERLIVLKPEQKKTIIFHAMCIESSDRCPNDDVLYAMGPMANDKLCKMTQYIGLNKYFNSSAQYAVWVFACNKPLEDIVGMDEEGTDNIIKKAAEILGKPVPKKPSVDDYVHNLHSTNMKRTIEGYVEYEFPTTENVSIAMFDKNNIVVRELYHNNAEKPGTHKQKFQFDGSVYKDKFYYIRLIVDDKVFYERKFELLPFEE